MAKSPKKPKLSTGKASKPELKPLDPYLADLLNPAVNREREAAEGFAERAQETFIHGDVTDVDPALAKKLGLKGPDDGPDVAHELGERSEEHTSELQSRQYLVCRLLLEKKKKKDISTLLYKTYERKDNEHHTAT